MLIYDSINYPVINLIPEGANKLLDVGCGNGALGKYLKVNNAKHHVTGITYSVEEAKLAEGGIDKVVIADLNEFDFSSLGKFDCIVCSHVLEHCYFPDQVLYKLKSSMEKGSILIVALPNVLHWKQRLTFLKGNFRYTDGGLMDKTHFRFFDLRSAQELIHNSGYTISEAKAIGNLPLPILRKILPSKFTKFLDGFFCSLFPGLFGFQFVFLCKVK